MKRTLIAALAVALLTTPVQAHDMHELKVSRVQARNPFIFVHINNTVKGQSITCAVYDKNGDLLTSTPYVTRNLATKVIVSFRGGDANAAKSARCVKN